MGLDSDPAPNRRSAMYGPPARRPSPAPAEDDDPDEGEDVLTTAPVLDRGEFTQALWDGDLGDDVEGLDSGIDEAVAAWMAQWRVEAAGNRPVDHLARDLMHGALLRNHRTPWFQQMARNPPGWARAAVAHLPPDQRAQAAQHLALRRMHGRHLLLLTHAVPEQGRSRANLDYFEGLLACRPYGVAVSWAGQAERVHDYTCQRPRTCPWCLARKAVALYKRLRRGPCRPSRGAGKHLLLARVELTSDLLPTLGEEEQVAAVQAGAGWIIEGGALNPYRRLRPEDVAHVREVWGRLLRDWASASGAVGGLLVYQVGPHRAPDGRACFLHDLAVLAEVPTATNGQRERLAQVSGIGSEQRLGFTVPVPGRGDCRVGIRAAALPADDRRALRYFWAGTDAGFDLARGGIAVNGNYPPRAWGWGLDGAVRLLPWFLFDEWQWPSHRRVMRGRHLALPFGTWRGALPRPPAFGDGLASPARAAEDRDRRARERPLHERNRRVAAAAAAERERALELARPLYRRLREASRRPVGRARLTSDGPYFPHISFAISLNFDGPSLIQES